MEFCLETKENNLLTKDSKTIVEENEKENILLNKPKRGRPKGSLNKNPKTKEPDLRDVPKFKDPEYTKKYFREYYHKHTYLIECSVCKCGIQFINRTKHKKSVYHQKNLAEYIKTYGALPNDY